MNLKNILVAVIVIAAVSAAKSEFLGTDSLRPEVGKPMPNFVLNNITHYKSKKASLSDFKGKWLFIDLWSVTCNSCIKSFPRVNRIFNRFKDTLTWVMVGKNDNRRNKGIQELYEKLSAKQNLRMPSAYDSLIAKKWGITSYPCIIVVDPAGIVRFVANGSDMIEERIKMLLEGKDVTFNPHSTYRVESPEFDPDRVTPESRLYRSVLARWNGERMYPGYELDIYSTFRLKDLEGGWSAAMVPLYALYNFAYIGRWTWVTEDTAYYGKYYPRPILKMPDSSLFKFDYNFNVGKGTYNYNLSIPPSEVSKERIMKLLQEDLKRVFKYDVSVENRNVQVWKLVAKPGAVEKLKTKGEKRYATPGSQVTGYSYKNWPYTYLIGTIAFYIADRYKEPFIDDTGIRGNVDFAIEADMTNLEDIRKELQKQGLDLVKGTKEMKVVIIREPKM